ncbi:hypothetical protein J2128_002102 [Methanomicrobium sp. W14]|uniref:hypothetical protein n=1 Tax=Methanomicrobium sp. W14 TaxID=2817839 RepID=UPI001AE70076|nr:hypothetical protein [Methanomicrobium sp. W14]MBP2134136.1 hypothetical protein [Methanomicrobium sp. W14]
MDIITTNDCPNPSGRNETNEKLKFSEYFHLIYLFYRHPKQAFEIINKGRAVHGILALFISVFVIQILYYTLVYLIYNVILSPFPYPLYPVIYGWWQNIPVIFTLIIIFGIEGIVLVALLKILKFRFQSIPALSVIFYSCAAAFPFTKIWSVLYMIYYSLTENCLFTGLTPYSTGGIISTCIFFIYVVPPLAYLEYTGLKGMLKKRPHLILYSVITAAAIHCILYVPVFLYLTGLLRMTFGIL